MSLAARLSPTGTAVTAHVAVATPREMREAAERPLLAYALMRVPGFAAHTRVSREGDCSVVLAFADGDGAVAATAAAADAHGAIVRETVEGWSAIEPAPEAWGATPGAHVRWSTYRLADDPLIGGPSLRVEGRRAMSAREIDSLQGAGGWSSSHEVAADGGVTAEYLHAEESRDAGGQ